MNTAAALEPVRLYIHTNNGKMPDAKLWPELNIDAASDRYEGDLTAGLEGDMIQFVRDTAAFRRFPVSSTFLLAMGTLATYTARHIWTAPFIGNDIRPLNMYVAVGAGSGEGKTPTIRVFSEPGRDLCSKMEQAKESKRKKLERQIAECRDEMKTLAKKNPDSDLMSIPQYKQQVQSIDQYEEEIKEIKPILWNMKQRNLQAMASIAKKQDGYIPVLADEMNTVSFLTGEAAGISTSLILDSFDGTDFGYGKLDEDITIDNVRAGICLAAQENIVEKLWGSAKSDSGESSGFMERFFVSIVKGVVGSKSSVPRGAEPLNTHRDSWRFLLRNVIGLEYPITLEFTEKAKEMIDNVHLKYDARCAAGGMFAQEPMRGFVQKSTAHIANIAGILFLMTYWARDFGAEKKPTKIPDPIVKQAADVFAKIVAMHLVTLTTKGIIGANTRAAEVRETISAIVMKKKKRLLTNAEIQQAAGGKSVFRNGAKLSAKELVDSIYPALEAQGVICAHGKTVYVNPNFA